MILFSSFTCRGELMGVASAYAYASSCNWEEQPKIFDATLSKPTRLSLYPICDLQLRNEVWKQTRHFYLGWDRKARKRGQLLKRWGHGEPGEAAPEATAALGSFQEEHGWATKKGEMRGKRNVAPGRRGTHTQQLQHGLKETRTKGAIKPHSPSSSTNKEAPWALPTEIPCKAGSPQFHRFDIKIIQQGKKKKKRVIIQ